MGTLILDPNVTDSSGSIQKITKKSAARVAAQSLNISQDGYHCVMAVQEHGVLAVIAQAADHYVKTEGMAECDALCRSSTEVRQHLNAIDGKGIYKEVRNKLNDNNSLNA